jgi:hypothetical protein
MLLFRISTTCTGLRLIHIHILVCALLALAFLVLLVFSFAVLNVDFLALLAFLVIGGGGASCVFCATHFSVFAFRGGSCAFGLDFFLLLFLFVGAILVAVGNEVCFRLVGRKLWGS